MENVRDAVSDVQQKVTGQARWARAAMWTPPPTTPPVALGCAVGLTVFFCFAATNAEQGHGGKGARCR